MLRLLAVVLVLSVSAPAFGQTAPPRYGVGFDVSTAVLGSRLIPDGPALGLRGRVALPVNADLSVAASLGVSAHLFDGANDSDVVLNPQTSLIVTIPGRTSVRYVLGGFGGLLPFSGGGGGATIHGGVGIAVPLSATSLYVEADPSLVIGQDSAGLLLSVRGGVIF